ncbi:MAG: arsenosugar biosynthesis radical SAM protein ArsS [Proteobacteria bacterium]|nr:arsenosugar biosynthesis radical SAM protein ArsS [Pseudomonadota bacterium]
MPSGQPSPSIIQVVEPFAQALARHGLTLTRGLTTTLQINVGLRCNQVCRHCHLEAGPFREEAMDERTVRQVLDYAVRAGFETADVTGGAPELNPHLPLLLEGLAAAAPRVMFRANLTALMEDRFKGLLDLLVTHRVIIVASFPALNPAQTDAQRGRGVFDRALAALKELNDRGYGRPDTGLELNLVSNPSGAFLPPDQAGPEKRFRRIMEQKWGAVFNHLYTFANVPLGRFKDWLRDSGNYEGYIERLARSFNPCAVEGLMCRNLVSVNWEGRLFDCDFNIAAGLPLPGDRPHVTAMAGPPEPGSPIAAADHCYTCTAGAGFT